MSSHIQALSTDLVHRIAAGEVIDSLTAAVRELIDNALDAQADRITISLLPTEWYIQVADNGLGMDRHDLSQAAAPHTTSKISTPTDLDQITTLGFRGEALHSLAQLGHLEICSRAASSNAGWRATYNLQGEMVSVVTTAIAPGTIVTVSDLFARWPARRAALPPPTQQLRALQTVIHQAALCHPQVTWQVLHNHRSWFSIAPGRSARDILPQLLNSVQANDLQGVCSEQVDLVLGLPDRCHRHRPDWVRVAINGRCVRVGEEQQVYGQPLEQTILQAFRQVLPKHRHPICFVHLRLPPEQVDWNRHPAKTEIHLQQLEHWRQQIAQQILQTLQLPQDNLTLSPSGRVKQLIKTAEKKGIYHTDPTTEASASGGSSRPLHQLRAIAQVHQTYILVEHPAGLWLVEQHIAHERVIYEQLCQNWQLVEVHPPVILSQLTPTQVERLQEIGIAIEIFGEQLWAVRSVPAILAERPDCPAALIELSLGDGLQAALVATACRSAIRNGTPLSIGEMQHLLDQWQQTQHPRTCPHGRPIYLALEESDLSRFFRRHWVVGKSHGI